jgi:hypothetical protein
MFLAFLNNYDIRPVTAQYLWVFYCLLHRLGKDDVAYILNEDYTKQYSPQDRWEMKPEIAAKNFYVPPEIVDFNEIQYFIGEKATISDNPSENLRHYIREYDPAILGNTDLTRIKAGLTWVNNKTFEEKCRQNNIPVIHNEFAVLRGPVYKDTFYFDFSGVNGNTEFRVRFESFKKSVSKSLLLSVEELIQLVTRSEYTDTLLDIYRNRAKRQYICGIPLQVMNDTNAIAYSNGWSNIDLITYSIKKYGRRMTLLRNHPACIFRATDRPCDRFDEGNCFEFIDKVDHVTTINSSVGFEALLLGKTVEYLGESPFDVANNLPAEDLLQFLNFAIISYIVPNKYLFNKDYYLYRLECFDENELFRVGLENWKNVG